MNFYSPSLFSLPFLLVFDPFPSFRQLLIQLIHFPSFLSLFSLSLLIYSIFLPLSVDFIHTHSHLVHIGMSTHSRILSAYMALSLSSSPFLFLSESSFFSFSLRILFELRVWKDLSLNDDLEEEERAQLAVWDYPVSDRATKIWAQMVEAKFPKGYDQAIHWVRKSKVNSREGYALVGKFSMIQF